MFTFQSKQLAALRTWLPFGAHFQIQIQAHNVIDIDLFAFEIRNLLYFKVYNSYEISFKCIRYIYGLIYNLFSS